MCVTCASMCVTSRARRLRELCHALPSCPMKGLTPWKRLTRNLKTRKIVFQSGPCHQVPCRVSSQTSLVSLPIHGINLRTSTVAPLRTTRTSFATRTSRICAPKLRRTHRDIPFKQTHQTASNTANCGLKIFRIQYSQSYFNKYCFCFFCC